MMSATRLFFLTRLIFAISPSGKASGEIGAKVEPSRKQGKKYAGFRVRDNRKQSASLGLRTVMVVSFASLLAIHNLALAGTPSGPDWSFCETGYQVPALPAVEAEDDDESGDPNAAYLSSDEADLSNENISTLLGNVQVRQGTRYISADKVQYNKSLGTIDTEGSFQAWDVGEYIVGKSAHVNMGSDGYRAEAVKFLLLDRHGQGTAKEIDVQGSKQIIIARDATYTTCPGSGDPRSQPMYGEKAKDQDWQLTAKKITLDKATDRGVARNVAVKFKNVPILYTPYLTFPLSDKRKTGFLMPSFGASDETGAEITVPFYWNIAPNQDATFAVREMTDRGALLQGEYRYLTELGAGKAELEYLPNDNKYDNDARTALRLRHDGIINDRWITSANFNWVSDKTYFEDMGNSMLESSARFLEQRADVRYAGNRWQVLGRLQGYQTIDETIQPKDRPYDRLPQLQFGTRFRERNRQLNFQVAGEWVYFYRDTEGVAIDNDGIISTNQRATGQRIDIMPSVSYPLRTPSAFLVPKLSLRHTKYSLNNTSPGESDSPERTLPIFSLDSGLFLERDAHIGKHTYTHTLEPRIYYLAAPFKDQSGLPIFDTGEYTFNFDKIFRENRFSGADRQGDADQVTLALTTRLLSQETAEELLRASIGQIRYLRDRKVYLPDADRSFDTNDSSEIIAEIAATAARRWKMVAGMQYDVEDNSTTKSNVSLRYQPDRHRIINVGYRYDDDYDEQASASFRWPLTRNWGTIGRWVYALPESRTVEAVAGIEYESCCWAVRAVAQRFLNGADEETNNAFFLQWELKGLSGVGRKTGDFLTRIVPGYENNF
uniref:LPS-assembly protein LptD n=1 Tax=Candidatus Kentrum sp. DK TaxID=2126562 RepID=A0A450SK67_9GAMM|nr:MAG: LPS-assembly protein [Candidatus Kentron sp. DK]